MEVTGYIQTSVAFPQERESPIFSECEVYTQPIDCLGICVDERNSCLLGSRTVIARWSGLYLSLQIDRNLEHV